MVKGRRRRAGKFVTVEDGAGAAPLGQGLQALLARMGGSPARARLAELKKRWPELLAPLLGAELAALCKPLRSSGPKGRKILHLGAPESLLLQELASQSQEILDCANAFLGAAYFASLRGSLLPEAEFQEAARALLEEGEQPPASAPPASPASPGPPPASPASLPASPAPSANGPGASADLLTQNKAPDLSGQGLEAMNPASPVARAYAAFLAARAKKG